MPPASREGAGLEGFPVVNFRLRSFVVSMREVQEVGEGGRNIQSGRSNAVFIVDMASGTVEMEDSWGTW